MKTEDFDKIYEQLQAKCLKCNKSLHCVSDAKPRKDKEGKSVVLCSECANKYKNQYREATEEEIRESAFTILLAMLVLGGKG